LAVALWVFLSILWPEEKLSLGLIGGSPGSSSTGANLFIGEAGALLLGLWAIWDARLRQRFPHWVWVGALAWCALTVLAGLRGLAAQHHPRDVAAEARIGVFAPALLALCALDPAGRQLARRALAAGLAAWCLWQGALIAAEPTGLYNPNIVPVPVAASEHAMHLQWFPSLGILLAGGLWMAPGLLGGLLATLAWVPLWLSLVRAQWLMIPLGAAVAAAVLWRGGQRGPVLRFLGLQIVAALLGMALTLGVYHASTPDGAFLFKFRLQRLAQSLHLAGPPPVAPDPGPACTPMLRGIVRRGGLYSDVAVAAAVQQSRQLDPSLSDRGEMLRLSWQAFRASPLLGQGLGLVLQVPLARGEFRPARDPHNGLAWLASKMGLIGVAFMAAVLGALGWALWRRRKGGPLGAAASAALVMVLGMEAFEAGLLRYSLIMTLMLLLLALREPDGA
jgi:hypothetical protein